MPCCYNSLPTQSGDFMDYRAIDYKNIPVQAEIISGIIRLDVESINCFRDLDSYVRSDQGVRRWCCAW